MLSQDFFYAFRRLRKTPLFTATAALILGIGTGANTAIFTVADFVLLRSLPVPRPHEIFLVNQGAKGPDKSEFSYFEFARLRGGLPDSANLAAATPTGRFYVGINEGIAESAKGQLVSGDYFSTLEISPTLGRLLAEEDNRTRACLVVLSYGYWKRKFGGDPQALHQNLRINGIDCSIIGVTPRDFFGVNPADIPDVWMPLTLQNDVHYAQHFQDVKGARPDLPFVSQEGIYWLQLIVRLHERTQEKQVRSALNQVFANEILRQDLHNNSRAPALALEPGDRGYATLRQRFSSPLLILELMVGILLIIACADVANLLLVRGAAREKEIAVCISLGANRRQIVTQLLAESILIASLGTFVGVLMARWSGTLGIWGAKGLIPISLSAELNIRILTFTALLALVTVVLFGLLPALKVGLIDPSIVIKTTERSGLGADRKGTLGRSLGNVIVIFQLALSVALLTEARMFEQSVERFLQLDPGFDKHHVLSVWIDPNLSGYSAEKLPVLHQWLINRIQNIPGVDSVALATCGIAVHCNDSSVIYGPESLAHSSQGTDTQENRITPDYFKTVGIPLLAGRDFSAADDIYAPRVAIVNQSFARSNYGANSPIGQRFGYDIAHTQQFVIIGVVGDARVNDIRESPSPLVYYPLSQVTNSAHSIEIQTRADPRSIATNVRRIVSDVDRDLPIIYVSPLSDLVIRNLRQENAIGWLITIFAVVALTLSCVGLYGVISYLVSCRLREFGIRLALGSTRSGLLSLVLRETLKLVFVGLLVGLIFSAITVRVTLISMSGMTAPGMWRVGWILVALAISVVISAIYPAWRASRVDPLHTLRSE